MIGPDEQNNPTDKKQGEKPSVNEVHVDQTIDQTYDNTMADDSYFAVNVRDEDLRGAIISRTSTIKRQRPRFNDELFGRVQWVLIMDIVNNLLNLLGLAILAIEITALGILAVSYLGMFIFSLYTACEYSSVRSVDKKIQTLKFYNRGRMLNLVFVIISLGLTVYFGSTYIYTNYIKKQPEPAQTNTSPSLPIYVVLGSISFAVILLSWNLFHIISNRNYFNGTMEDAMKASIVQTGDKGLNDFAHSEDSSARAQST